MLTMFHEKTKEQDIDKVFEGPAPIKEPEAIKACAEDINPRDALGTAMLGAATGVIRSAHTVNPTIIASNAVVGAGMGAAGVLYAQRNRVEACIERAPIVQPANRPTVAHTHYRHSNPARQTRGEFLTQGRR